MSKWKLLIPALAIFAALPSISQAQVSVPVATYNVQVQKELWKSGGTYWTTVYSTDDREVAYLMEEFLLVALENNIICQFINCSPDSIIRDVRVGVVWNLPLLEALPYRPISNYQRQSP